MNIGLVAHDSKKKLMQNFCIAYRGILSKNNLYATGTTGRLIEEVANLSVHKYLACPALKNPDIFLNSNDAFNCNGFIQSYSIA